MAIVIKETFRVEAPIEDVWRFMMTPDQIVTCMPGAELDEIVDEATFAGTVKIKVGAVTAKYKGRIRFTSVEAASHAVEMTAEGRETSGGVAKGTIAGRLTPVEDGQTEVVAQANVDLTGRIVQVGRGMIQGVSQQLFAQFVDNTKRRLEAQRRAAEATPAGAAPAPESPLPAQRPIRIVPLVLRVMWLAIARFFGRLLGRSPA